MDVAPWEPFVRLVVAVILGAAIGVERELHDKPVGFRSNTLICLGAALFTMFSLHLSAERGDPARVAAQVVTGIGFLGAGSILRHGDRVQGITTAATIWLVAALGMGAGAGFYAIAVAGTVLALLVLGGFRRMERTLERRFDTRTYRVGLRDVTDDASRAEVARIIEEASLRTVRHHREVTEGRRYDAIRLTGDSSRHAALQERLASLPTVFDLRVI